MAGRSSSGQQPVQERPPRSSASELNPRPPLRDNEETKGKRNQDANLAGKKGYGGQRRSQHGKS